MTRAGQTRRSRLAFRQLSLSLVEYALGSDPAVIQDLHPIETIEGSNGLFWVQVVLPNGLQDDIVYSVESSHDRTISAAWQPLVAPSQLLPLPGGGVMMNFPTCRRAFSPGLRWIITSSACGSRASSVYPESQPASAAETISCASD